MGLCALKSDLLAVKTEREALLPLKNGTAKSVKFQQIPRFFIKFLAELTTFASMQAPLGPIADDDISLSSPRVEFFSVCNGYVTVVYSNVSVAHHQIQDWSKKFLVRQSAR